MNLRFIPGRTCELQYQSVAFSRYLHAPDVCEFFAMDPVKSLDAHLQPETISSQRSIVVLSSVGGFLAHKFFQRFEPDTFSYGQFILTLAVGLGWFFNHYLGSIGAAALYTTESLFILNVVLLLSMVIYRLSPWHPLAKYPGPWQGKVSKLYWWHQAQIGETGYTQAKLHKQYGTDFVRIGPNWISVRSADAIPVIYGGSKTGAVSGRAPWAKNDW